MNRINISNHTEIAWRHVMPSRLSAGFIRSPQVVMEKVARA